MQNFLTVSKDPSSCSYVFLRTDALQKGLQPPYGGPFQVLDRNEKTFKINKNGKELTVNIDRVKPVYVLRDCDSTRLDFLHQSPQHHRRTCKRTEHQRHQQGLPDLKL
ncbi:hypothetical protein AVEN_29099-1 [Araneus ventricosus]|uniref:Uncharacterized protein n=1 Tax=Araneus ventricosus TaxID=182803 RepID=A0A4Y2ALI6_ARAVE|nr:hypothetical protein AVEN_29099-1 [Araneus ventricosus]